MSSIIVHTNTQQYQYHIIIFVCCSFVILLILYIVCIGQKESPKIVKSYKDEFKPHCEVVPPTENRKKIKLNNTTYKCNGIRPNGSPCRQDGTKSGGKIINGYCNYHKKMRN